MDVNIQNGGMPNEFVGNKAWYLLNQKRHWKSVRGFEINNLFQLNYTEFLVPMSFITQI